VKKLILVSISIIISIAVSAHRNSQYIIICSGGGLHGIQNNIKNGENKMGIGFSFNASYQYCFSSNWGIIIGVGVQSAKSTVTLNFTSSQDATDTDGDNYIFRSYFSEWKENQNVLIFEIPLKVSYQYPINKKFDIIVSAGLKAMIPIKADYKVKSGQISTTGYYEQWNVELTDMPQHGFTTITKNFTDDISLKTLASISTGIGGIYRLNKETDLYFDAYFDYGLNNMANKSSKKVYQDNGIYNGILGSELINKVSLINTGLKIGVRLNLSKWFKTGNRRRFHS
jgi:OmpA-OmpF porin, OOP family